MKQRTLVLLILWTVLVITVAACRSEPQPVKPTPTVISPTRISTAPATEVAAATPVASVTPAHSYQLSSPDAVYAAIEEASETGDIDGFWQAVLAAGGPPLTFRDRAIFLYRGPAEEVEWTLEYAISNRDILQNMAGTQQGESDLWLHEATFPGDARLSYRVVVDGVAQPDPYNIHRSREGAVDASELRMPDYRPRQQSRLSFVSPPGRLGDLEVLESRFLRYALGYRVYTPAAYAQLDHLPVIYVADGSEYADAELGNMVGLLDELIAAGRIEPVIAVFIDSEDPVTGRDRRSTQYLANQRYTAFLARELVPAIDASYRTDPKAERRALIGASWGGLNAAYAGLHYADTFGMIGLQSPIWIYYRLVRQFQEAELEPLRLFYSVGTVGDTNLTVSRYMRDLLAEKGFDVHYVEVADNHAWGNYRRTLPEALIFFFGNGTETAK